MTLFIQRNHRLVILLAGFIALFFTSACSTNPATGKSQFAALMSPSDELKVGAQEHEKIIAQFGLYDNKEISAYVSRIGQRVAQDTERPDIRYKFYVLDSPIVNAFALPGGYVYISRGLLALANNEAELAAVLAHEVGHITGRHSAERYSHSVLSSVGTSVLSILLDNRAASQLLGVGNNLYLSSYSRGQENEADTLGIRYLEKAGYDAGAMSDFLDSLKAFTKLEDKVNDRKNTGTNYFATHPETSDRVAKTEQEAADKGQGRTARNEYLNAIKGLTFGDSRKQGFVRNDTFYHPEIGFKFDVPKNYRVQNSPSQVAMVSSDKEKVMIFDMDRIKSDQSLRSYMSYLWMKEQDLQDIQTFEVHAMPAVSARFDGYVNNKASKIILAAIEWQPKNYARFQIASPKSASKVEENALFKTVQSFINLSSVEKDKLGADYVDVFKAKGGESISQIARSQALPKFQEEYFRVLNDLPESKKQLNKAERYKKIIAP